MSHIVRIMCDGEVLCERDHGDSQVLAEAHYTSAVNKYSRKDDDISEGVTIQRLEGEEIREEGTFAMGFFYQ